VYSNGVVWSSEMYNSSVWSISKSINSDIEVSIIDNIEYVSLGSFEETSIETEEIGNYKIIIIKYKIIILKNGIISLS
jgi:hypothetical protein